MSPRREGRVFLGLVLRSPLTLFIACATTFLTALLLFVGAGVDGLDFLYAPQARLWHMLAALLTAFTLAAVLLASRHLWGEGSVWPRAWGERLGVLLCSLLCLALTELPFLAQLRRQPYPLGLDPLLGMPDWYLKSVLATLSIGGVVALLYSGPFGIHIQLIRALALHPPGAKPSPGPPPEEELRRYQRLRSQLDLFLRLLAVMDGLALLTLGALRNLLNEVAPAEPELMPAASVLGFGLYFTALLAGVYLPARMTLAAVGEALAERLVRPLPPEGTGWKAWSEEQQAVRTWLGLQGSSLADLQQALSVLVPFLASLSTLLLDGKG
jgi:hypothetical protein